MNIAELTLSFVVGLTAGAAYFAALWLTVQRLTRDRLSPVWLLLSAAVRLAFLIGVLFWIMDGQLDRLFAALAGFLLIRFAAIWPIRMSKHRAREPAAITTPEAADATDAR
jgi:F1F0 ATPase subunit 2